MLFPLGQLYLVFDVNVGGEIGGRRFRRGDGLCNCVVDERLTLDLTIDQPGLSTTATMTYDNNYDDGSDLANVEAMYDLSTSILFGNSLTAYNIDSAGVISGSFMAGGGTLNCIISGQVTVVDAAYNAYDVDMNVADCGVRTGDYIGLGVTRTVTNPNDRFSVRIFMDQRDVMGFGGANK